MTPSPPPADLPPAVVADLRRINPWWEGKPQPPLPATRRHLVDAIHRRLDMRLAPAIVVRGPRQVGKTTAGRQVIQDRLDKGVRPTHILAVQFDELPGSGQLVEPLLRIVDWYEQAILGMTLNEAAHAGQPTLLVFDELQNVLAWAPQLKFLVDHSATTVLVTGSSALRIEAGRDSLAGRITTIEAGALSLTEIALFHGLDLGGPFLADNGLAPLRKKEFWLELRAHGRRLAPARDAAFARFSARGAYPLAHQRDDVDWAYIADQLNETVIRRVIQHDLHGEDNGQPHDRPILEEVFRLACRYAGQSPSPQLFTREIQRVLASNVDAKQVQAYLRMLADSLLVRLVPPLEIRLKRSRGHPRICLADHGLRASWLDEVIPLDPAELAAHPDLTGIAGHIAESVVGATLSTVSGLDVAHVPAHLDEPEVDFVLMVGDVRIPLDVKYQRRIDPFRDTEGLRSFIEKTINRAPFGLLVTQTDIEPLDDPRIVALPLATLMLAR